MNPQVEKAATVTGAIVLSALILLLLNFTFKRGYVQKLVDWIARSIGWCADMIIKALIWVLSTQIPKVKEVTTEGSN